jgi:uncharacterized membrane protein YhhN
MTYSLRIALVLLFLAWIVLLPVNVAAGGMLGMTWLWRWWYLSSAVLSLTAWAVWAASRRSPLSGLSLGVALGMTLGMLADVYGIVPRAWRFAETMTVIMPLFSLGHVAYIGGCASAAGWLGLKSRFVWAVSVGGWLLVGIVTWYAATQGATQQAGLRWPSLGYTVLLAGTAGAMTALAAQHRRFAALALGGAMFFISDAILAIHVFHDAPWYVLPTAWSVYGTGQMLIVFGAALAVLPDAGGAELKTGALSGDARAPLQE